MFSLSGHLHSAVRICASLVLLSVHGCASHRYQPDWRIAFDFEDETSCGYYRTIKIFDDGRVTYDVERLQDPPTVVRIEREQVDALAKMLKTFRLVEGTFGDQSTLPSRGTSSEHQVLKDEIARLAHLEWKDFRSSRSTCPISDRPRPFPVGQLWLREDF